MDHFKCREKVCGLCFCMKGKKAGFKVNQSQEIKIRKCIPEYDSSNPAYPVGLCDACRKILNSQKGSNPRKMNFPDYEPAAMCPITMVVDDEHDEGKMSSCACEICRVAKLNGKDFLLYSKEPKLMKKCDICGSDIARGSDHSVTKCNQLKLQNLSEREKEIVAFEFLKSRKAATVKLSGSHGGNKLQVAVGSQGCIT